jgi:hypothetical protein
MEFAAMFELEVHKGPLILFANTVYYKGKYDEDFTGQLSGAVRNYSLEEEVWAVKYGAGYRFGPWNLNEGPEPQTLSLIPWAGAFFFSDDWEVNVTPAGKIFDGVEKSGTLDFNTPMIGLGARWKITQRWYVNLSYGAGGWSVDDVDNIYDFIGNVGYRFSMKGVSSKVFAGYRYLHIDYEKDPVELNVDIKGPFIGIGWEF